MIAMKRYAGVTLLEVLLVLAITGMAFVMGLRLYYSFKTDADIMQVKSNVDAIFLAMAKYYRANCYGTTRVNAAVIPMIVTITPGTLNPASSPTNPMPINIQTDLINAGYLRSTLVRTPIVNFAGSGMNGYVAQFN